MTIPRSLRHFAEGKATLLHAGKKDTEKAEGYTYNKSAALLFFPAAGYGENGDLFLAGTGGNYWSSTLGSGGTDNAYGLGFSSGDVSPQTYRYRYRYLGYSVRPLSD